MTRRFYAWVQSRHHVREMPGWRFHSEYRGGIVLVREVQLDKHGNEVKAR